MRILDVLYKSHPSLFFTIYQKESVCLKGAFMSMEKNISFPVRLCVAGLWRLCDGAGFPLFWPGNSQELQLG